MHTKGRQKRYPKLIGCLRISAHTHSRPRLILNMKRTTEYGGRQWGIGGDGHHDFGATAFLLASTTGEIKKNVLGNNLLLLDRS